MSPMVNNSSIKLDERTLGQRLKDARKARGLTQEAVAADLGLPRTSIVAIESGQRRVQPRELTQLAALYGHQVGELVRPDFGAGDFVVQLRSALAPRSSDEAGVNASIAELESLAGDYRRLESLRSVDVQARTPDVYALAAGIDPEAAGEDIALRERMRLGLGDGPIEDLRGILESDVGLRIFYFPMESRIAAMFAFVPSLGGCIAVNRNHPEERRRMSLCHDYAHFLTSRFRPEVTEAGRYQRLPDHERLAESFARNFLMPATSVRRRSNDLMQQRNGSVTAADLCLLAYQYRASVEAMALRLEELGLLRTGTWERLRLQGFRVREAQRLLALPERPAYDDLLPLRYRQLAVELFEAGDISEGQFAKFLRIDRVSARAVASGLQELQDPISEAGHSPSLRGFGGELSYQGTPGQ
jgi:Zn-dependent peptidase ImmA (M78 family)/transcriptional regulator with XRE-family HTH domain